MKVDLTRNELLLIVQTLADKSDSSVSAVFILKQLGDMVAARKTQREIARMMELKSRLWKIAVLSPPKAAK